MSDMKIAVVTGANKGIGLAIVRQLALQYPKSSLHSGPFLVYLTARSPERGAAAVKELQQDEQLRKAKSLAADGGATTISYAALDISNKQSIHALGDFLKKEHPDGIDIVINNAGIALQGFDAAIVRETFATNYYGSLEATNTFLPLLRRGGRMVNVASSAGRLNKYSDEIHEAFRSASQTSVPAVTALMQRFQTAADEDRLEQEGFTKAAYAASKVGEIAFTKVIAMEEEKRGRDVLVNACCPGYVVTDMTRGGGSKTPDQGAQTPVLLALGEIGGKTGGFWRDEKESVW